ncbi:peptidylprolyl isomerase [Tabrizicola sp.]|uniref:peptidylprolyl isomerase n=1 Tax=Tabrizicola sp. TaxID=2005166 RepID=UPI002611367B|nr:peptidylprolyl isomerase [Tabrizicola sp.]MDM7931620.1 peptidylprolyl isomerase [Tabrizicola sp.]
MLKQARIWPGLALMAALATPVWAEGETADTVVSTVNGVTITLGHMIALRESLPPQYQSLPDDVLFNGILDQLVQQEVLRQSVKDLSPRHAATLENDTRGYVSGVAIEAIVLDAVTDTALQAAYDARFMDAAPQTEYNAAHILVVTLEEAEQLKSDLAGGADFAELAKANSIDTGSGANGGELGWFGVGVMVKPFEEAVLGATVGEVAGPIQTDFGYHLVLVKETRNAENPPLDQIRDELAAEIENAAIEARLKELTDAATVTREGEGIDPTILKNVTLID